MPNGTYVISTDETFTAAILMGSGPKLRFGTAEQDVSASGERKWEAQLAVTFRSEYGMKAVSDVISLTITGGASDPCEGITPGTSVALERLRVGFSAPERGQGDRIRGGKPWYQAAGVRPAHGQQRKAEAA